MNKVYIGVGALVLALLGGLYFMVDNSPIEQTENNPFPAASSTDFFLDWDRSKITHTEPKIDLAKLPGKDRLYTEDEGRFENLSEEEQIVLIEAYYCRDYKSYGKKACKQHAMIYGGVEMENVRLLALKNGVAVVYVMSWSRPKGRLYIHNLEKQELVEEFIDSGDMAIGSDFIIRVNRSGKDNSLELYRPGMLDFMKIPNSLIEGAEYAERSDPLLRNLPIKFNKDSITVYLHTYKNCVDVGGAFAPGFLECEVATKVPRQFDLSGI